MASKNMKLSIIIPHFRAWTWLPICVHAFKKYPASEDQQIIVVNNSGDHPSIKALTETSLGEGVKILCGNPEFTAHGLGYDIGATAAESDWIFTAETDSFPTRKGWFKKYEELTNEYRLIGPDIPQSAGHYIHPAGALTHRTILDRAAKWREQNKEYVFVPSAGIELGTSDRAYHVVAKESWVRARNPSENTLKAMELWKITKSWQEMRSFDDDTFETFSQRTGIRNFAPTGQDTYNKIGYEAGQWLAYFAEGHGFPVFRAPVQIEWMKGFENGQAARSTVFDGFEHIWCGTVSSVENGLNPFVRAYKMEQADSYFTTLPPKLREQITILRKHSGE